MLLSLFFKPKDKFEEDVLSGRLWERFLLGFLERMGEIEED
jgi:hypothetical protein